MNLTTTYMGMQLRNPIIPSASPLSEKLDGIRTMEDAGAAAIVMYSLFEEQVINESEELDYHLNYRTYSSPESLTYFPEMETYHVGPDVYLDLIRRASEAVDIPVIGSLNGVSSGGWTKLAKSIQEAGAKGIELNVYYIPTDTRKTGAEVEQAYIDVLKDVKSNVSIPVAMKLSPFFSSTAYMAQRFSESGANALVLFNRFYQPDFDLDKLEVLPNLTLSTSAELRLPLRWIAILFGKVQADLALTGGVHTPADAVKGLMAGAKAVMMTSELLQNGIFRISDILQGVEQWMEEHGYDSIKQMQGSMSQQKVADPTSFERANYMKVLKSFGTIPYTAQ